MISRVADSCFWLTRYLERVDTMSRLLQVSFGFSVDVDLPASGWVLLGTPARPKGYRFVSTAGPVTKVILKVDQLKIRAGGPAFGYTLDEPAQGAVAVGLSFDATTGWCASAPAKLRGNPPSTATSDRVGHFIGAAAPGPTSTGRFSSFTMCSASRRGGCRAS